jgi:hypothetical protein
MSAVRDEERDAAAKLRKIQKAQREAARIAANRRRRKLATVIRVSKQMYPSCRCSLSADMSREQLVALGAGCDKRAVCRRLDRVRRTMGI